MHYRPVVLPMCIGYCVALSMCNVAALRGDIINVQCGVITMLVLSMCIVQRDGIAVVVLSMYNVTVLPCWYYQCAT